MEIEKAAGVARRGAYVRRSPELKAAIVAECLVPRASVAAVASESPFQIPSHFSPPHPTSSRSFLRVLVGVFPSPFNCRTPLTIPYI